MEEHILEFITEEFQDSYDYVLPDEMQEVLQNEELFVDDSDIVSDFSDNVSSTQDVNSEDIVTIVNDAVSSPEVQELVPDETIEKTGGTYNVYNITLNQVEDISEVPDALSASAAILEATTATTVAAIAATFALALPKNFIQLHPLPYLLY